VSLSTATLHNPLSYIASFRGMEKRKQPAAAVSYSNPSGVESGTGDPSVAIIPPDSESCPLVRDMNARVRPVIDERERVGVTFRMQG
jgi:hypothetical protein